MQKTPGIETFIGKLSADSRFKASIKQCFPFIQDPKQDRKHQNLHDGLEE